MKVQNDELLFEVLEGKEFFIPCTNHKNAHSKAVSLSNARRKLPPDVQAKIRVQKLQIDGVFGVKLSPAVKTPIFQIKDGKLELWEKEESGETSRIVELMRKDGVSEEQIKQFLKGETNEAN